MPISNLEDKERYIMARVPKDRSFLKFVAVILFVLAAIFLFAVHSIGGDTDLGLIALGLAAWALA